MAVAEFDFDGVVADEFPGGDGDVVEVFGGIAAVMVAEDVFFADFLCGRGVGS